MIPGYTKEAFIKLASERYIVVKGDTLSGLDKRHKLPQGSFLKANPKVNPLRMREGQYLNMPKGVRPIQPKVRPVNKNYVRTRPAGAKLLYFPTIDQHGKAIRYAEHAGTPSDKQMIRTTKRPGWDTDKNKWEDYSTAFGWAQIVRKTAKGFMDSSEYGPYMRKRHGAFWDKYMGPTYQGFKDWSDKWYTKNLPIPEDKVWGFGGHGNFPRDQWDNYDKFAYDIMKLKILERNKRNDMRNRAQLSPDEYIKRQVRYWRGEPDAVYMDKYYDELYKNNPELFSGYKVPALTPEQLKKMRIDFKYSNDVTDAMIQDMHNKAFYYRLKNRQSVLNPSLR